MGWGKGEMKRVLRQRNKILRMAPGSTYCPPLHSPPPCRQVQPQANIRAAHPLPLHPLPLPPLPPRSIPPSLPLPSLPPTLPPPPQGESLHDRCGATIAQVEARRCYYVAQVRGGAGWGALKRVGLCSPKP